MITKNFKELISLASKDTTGYPNVARALEKQEAKQKARSRVLAKLAQETVREQRVIEALCRYFNCHPIHLRAAVSVCQEVMTEPQPVEDTALNYLMEIKYSQ